MIKIKRTNKASFLEYEEEHYKTLLSDLERIPDFFKYVQLINELAYREGFTFYTGNYYRSIKIDPIPRILKKEEFWKIYEGLKVGQRQ
ncbi:MAG: hypothetical protein OWQ50_04135 [Acidianus infernus]|uniref:hypothetical protein n=1 Tax=Acidianus infernus TaxID=12915 RepID=UPI002273646C|nr:hypothetical protein [Acidianus infernus]